MREKESSCEKDKIILFEREGRKNEREKKSVTENRSTRDYKR